MDDATIQIIIQTEVAKLKNDLDAAKNYISGFGASAGAAVNEISTKFLDFKTILSSALGFDLASLAASAVSSIKQFSEEAFNDTLKMEDAMNAFKLAVGASADSLRGQLKEAVHGTVDDLELVTAANRALALGINENHLVDLMSVARAQSKIMGTSVTESFDSISMSIAHMNSRGLVNAGIVIDLKSSYEEYAQKINVATDALTDEQKREAIQEEVLSHNKVLIDAINSSLDSHKDALDKAKVAMHDFAEREVAGLIEIYDTLQQEHQIGMEAMKMQNDLGMSWWDSRDKARDLAWETSYLSQVTDNTAASAKKLTDQEKSLRDELDQTITSMKSLSSTPLQGEGELNVQGSKEQQELDKSQLQLQQELADVKAKYHVDELSYHDGSMQFLLTEMEQRGQNTQQLMKDFQQQELTKQTIKEQTDAVKLLSLQKKAEYDDTHKILDDELNLWINQKTGVIRTKEEVINLIAEKKDLWKKDMDQIPQVKTQEDLLNASYLRQIDLINTKRRAAGLNPIHPEYSQYVAPTVQQPLNYTPISASSAANTTMNISIGQIYGVNADDISTELRKKLNDLVST